MSIDDYWEQFCEDFPEAEGQEFQCWHFGRDARLASELAELVLQGKKTATSSLTWEYDEMPEQRPSVGVFSVVTDLEGDPKCIVRTTDVKVLPFNEVDAAFAFDEGEGDQSLDHWRGVHWEYFSRQCLEGGRAPSETMPVICERFELVYPKISI